MLKTFLVYVHLIAACLSIGVLLTQDIKLAKWRGRPLDKNAILDLRQNAALVTLTLIILWMSGLVIVAIGYLDNPAYLLNQKLWGKFTVVCILTINGFFLHHYSFNILSCPTGFMSVNKTSQLYVLITGVVSLVSWFYSCYLGIARAWNNVAAYEYVMTIYAIILLATFLIALELWRELRNEYRLLAS